MYLAHFMFLLAATPPPANKPAAPADTIGLGTMLGYFSMALILVTAIGFAMGLGRKRRGVRPCGPDARGHD